MPWHQAGPSVEDMDPNGDEHAARRVPVVESETLIDDCPVGVRTEIADSEVRRQPQVGVTPPLVKNCTLMSAVDINSASPCGPYVNKL